MGAQLALPLEMAPAKAPRPRASFSSPSLTFEAGSHSRRAIGWNAPTLGPNDSILFDLLTLRNRSRQAVRNNGYAKGVIDRLVSNIIGTGMRPRSQADDVVFRKQVQALWAQWVERSDAYGLLDFYGQQAQIVRSWLEAGEVFIRLRNRFPQDGLPVSLQMEVLEAELCPHLYNGLAPVTGNRIRAGIEHDNIGRRVAYWFYQSRPGEFVDWNFGDLRRVDAQFVLHVFDPLRPGQLRGLPHLTQALVKLWELDKYDDATLLRQQIANLFAGFIQRPGVDDVSLNPLTGQAADDSEDGRPVVALQPGTMQELGPGEEIQFSDPKDPPATYPSFMKQGLLAASAATGVPYEVLTGDLSGLNDRVMRVLLHEFRRSVQARQDHIVEQQLCRPVWETWMDRALMDGKLVLPQAAYDSDLLPWSRVQWSPHAWPYLHPVQDIEASRAAIRSGFTTRSAIVNEQGEDSDLIDQEQAEDNARADELGLKYESDFRTQIKDASAGAPGSGGGSAAPVKEDD